MKTHKIRHLDCEKKSHSSMIKIVTIEEQENTHFGILRCKIIQPYKVIRIYHFK